MRKLLTKSMLVPFYCAAIITGNSVAEETAAVPGGGEIEEIVVTGSHLKRESGNQASPLTVLDRDDLDVVGATDVKEIIRSMSFNSGSLGVSATNWAGDDSSTGNASVNLRNLGIDLALAYARDAGAAGFFRTSLDLSYTLDYDIILADGEKIKGMGSRNAGNSIGRPMPRWRANAGLGWQRGRHNMFLERKGTDLSLSPIPPVAPVTVVSAPVDRTAGHSTAIPATAL